MIFDRNQLLLYAITDSAWVGKYTLLEQIEQAIIGGATIVQLREKNMCEEDFVSEAIKVKEICKKYNIPLIINDNLDVAIKSNADGVHVGIEDVAVEEIRKKMGKEFIIGATAKTVQQAKNAQKAGADYLGVGAVFPSPTKSTAIRITNQQLQEITSSVSIPCVAIGGITLDNMQEIDNCGVCGVAVVSAIFKSDNIIEDTKKLKQKSARIVGLKG